MKNDGGKELATYAVPGQSILPSPKREDKKYGIHRSVPGDK